MCTWLAGIIPAASLLVLAPGCGGTSSELEKPPAVSPDRPLDPMKDMPGFKESQENAKNSAKKR